MKWVHDGALFLGDEDRDCIFIGVDHGSLADPQVEWLLTLRYHPNESIDAFIERANLFVDALNRNLPHDTPRADSEDRAVKRWSLSDEDVAKELRHLADKIDELVSSPPAEHPSDREVRIRGLAGAVRLRAEQLDPPAEQWFTFDVKLFGTARVKAVDEEVARKVIDRIITDMTLFEGDESNNNLSVYNVNPDGRHELSETEPA